MTIDLPLESPQGNVLSYSIISSDEEENPLILKLKISDSNKVPLVLLKRLENESHYAVSPKSSNRSRKLRSYDEFGMNSPETINNDNSTPRKRGRVKKSEVSDVEMPSPTKIQKYPNKKCDLDNNLDSICSSITNKVNLTTPVKRSLRKSQFTDSDDSAAEVSPRKRGTATETSVKTPRRRGSRKLDCPMKTDENEGVLSGKRRSCAPVRYADEYSPSRSVKVNLNESFRRSILRSRHNVDNIGISKKPAESSLTPRRSTRKGSFQHAYEPFEDNRVLDDRTCVKSGVSASRRVLRSRSNSTVSNASTTSVSDSDYAADDSVPRGHDRTRLRKTSVMSNDSKSPERETVKKNPKTPRTQRNRRQTIGTPKSAPQTPKTPKNRLKLLRDGVITPSMHSRSSTVAKESTPLMKARSQLHVSHVPKSLPCREKEYQDVYNFLRGKLDDGCGGCMYISGVPGTGKTATVTSVIARLLNDREVAEFSYVSINGMRLTEPRQSYVEIWKQLTGKTVPWEQAQSLLEERFTKKKNMCPVVMLIDELDILCTKRQDVVYNLLDWPTKSKDQLIVITIANTMDLPERLLMSRVTSRLGLTRLTFQAYTHKQLMEIVTKRLLGTNSFNSDAVQLVARKVASVSGDARRALDICRRAAEIAEEEGKGQLVNIMHINEALTAMITQPQVLAMRRCSRLQKLLLQAIVAEIERTGVEETTFADVIRMLISCCAVDGFKMVSITTAQRALCQLSACKLILTDQKCRDIYQRIILNVSVHDVYFALKKE